MTLVETLLARSSFLVAILLIGVGVVVLIEEANLLRKVIGLNLFQTGVFLFFVAGGLRAGGRSPNLAVAGPYVDPVPQVLVLTAIVVGVSVTAVALALIGRLYRTFGTLDETEIPEGEP